MIQANDNSFLGFDSPPCPVRTVGEEAAFLQCDCVSIPLPNNSVDLVFSSPPYEGQRLYGEIQFDKTGQAWVDWALPRGLIWVMTPLSLSQLMAVPPNIPDKIRSIRWL